MLSSSTFAATISSSQLSLCKSMNSQFYATYTKKKKDLKYPYFALYKSVAASIKEKLSVACSSPDGMDMLMGLLDETSLLCKSKCGEGAKTFFVKEFSEASKQNILSTECISICDNYYQLQLKQMALSYHAYF